MYPQVPPPVAPPFKTVKSLPGGYDLPFGGGYFFVASSLLMIFGSFAFRVSCAHEFASGLNSTPARTNPAINREYLFILVVTVLMAETDGTFRSFKEA